MRKRTHLEPLEVRRLLASVVVSNTNDSGAGSLRQAIADAHGGDTIDLTSVSGTITVGSWLNVDKALTIEGPGQDELAISGGGTARIFNQAANLTLLDVTLTDAAQTNGSGGAIYQGQHALTMTRVTVSDSTARDGGAISNSGWPAVLNLTDCTFTGNSSRNGGAILSYANVSNFTRCTFSGNSAVGVPQPHFMQPGQTFAGSSRGGAISLYQGNVTFTNCTIANNSVTGVNGTMGTASAWGGGVYYVNHGSTTFVNCTIAGNSATAVDARGGGIYFDNNTHTVTNTIIAGNTTSAGTEPDVHVSGGVTSGGYNLIGAIEGNATFVHGTNHDQVGTIAAPIDAKLEALADNGGATRTVALKSDSPAVNAGTATGAPASDQRGQARVGATDVGAFELTHTNAAPAFTSTEVTSARAGYVYTYNVTATDADAGDWLTVDATTKPAWLTVDNNGDGTATLTGTPGYGDFGLASLVLEVSDGEAPADVQTFSINVTAQTFALDSGTLYVSGTDAADDIHVWTRNKNSVRAMVNGQVKNYANAQVQRIEVYGYAGDDVVLVNPSLTSSYIAGGDGNDHLTGGPGTDILSGGAGKDILVGNEGDDRLNGGGGHDRLVGGMGLDRLYGNDGNDLLYARDTAADALFGGAGNDSAEKDDADPTEDVEAILA